MVPDANIGRHELTPADNPFEYVQNLFPGDRMRYQIGNTSVLEIEKGLHPLDGQRLQPIIRLSHALSDAENPHESYLFSKSEILHADWDPQKPRLVQDYPFPEVEGALTDEDLSQLNQRRLTAIATAIQEVLS